MLSIARYKFLLERLVQFSPVQVHSVQMEVLESGESFEEINGKFKYVNTLVVYRLEDNIYHAISKSRCRFTAYTEPLDKTVAVPAGSHGESVLNEFGCR